MLIVVKQTESELNALSYATMLQHWVGVTSISTWQRDCLPLRVWEVLSTMRVMLLSTNGANEEKQPGGALVRISFWQ